MDFILDTRFEGVIDHDAFVQSVKAGLRRHPLLNSTIQVAKRGMPCWVFNESVQPQVDSGPMEKPIRLSGTEYIDLTNETGLRLWIRSDDHRTRILWQFHHACTDGIGGYRFVGDVLVLYAKAISPQSNYELYPLEFGNLKHRHRRVADLAYGGDRWLLRRRSIHLLMTAFGRAIQTLSKPIVPAPEGKSVFPGIEVHIFDVEQHERIRQVSITLGCTVNDLLLACLFEAIYGWNVQQRCKRQKKWLRIMMPTDMRETCDYATPATNLMSYTFIDRKSTDCRDARMMLEGIRAETALIKHERRGTQFCDALTVCSATSKKILPWLLSGDRCRATVVLSNVGDPIKRFNARLPRSKGMCVAGNLVLDEFTGVPPLRSATNATISITSFLRQLCISVRCDQHLFAQNQTQSFLRSFADCIWNFVQKSENEHSVRSLDSTSNEPIGASGGSENQAS